MRAAVAMCLLSLTACGRAAGPNDDEVGKEFVWEIVPTRNSVQQCANAGPMAQYTPQLPTFASDLVYYYIYSVDAGEQSVSAADCPQPITSWDDCHPGTERWPVSHHVISLGSQTGKVDVGGGCTMTIKETAAITDQGQTGSEDDKVAYSLSGTPSACQAFDAEMKRESSTGKGVDGCTATVHLGLMFALVKDW